MFYKYIPIAIYIFLEDLIIEVVEIINTAICILVVWIKTFKYNYMVDVL